MNDSSRNREHRLRHALRQAGYGMRKSHKPISGDNYGGYMVYDLYTRCVVANSGNFDLSLDDIEEWLDD